MLGQRQVHELSAGRLMENPEGRLEVPPLLLLLSTAAVGRRSLLLSIGEPVTLLETFLGSPNGTKDHIVEELLLTWHPTPYLCHKVDRDVNLQLGLGEVL